MNLSHIRTLSSLVALAALSSLVACGGGGGGSESTPAPAPTPVASTSTVNVPTSTTQAVGSTVALTWSNTAGAACTGTGLLSGITASTGTVQVQLTTEGQASYSVSCGGTASNVETLTVLPQFTQITDPVFEQALISAGVDDVIDGQVSTAKVLAVTKLAILSGAGYVQAPDVQVATTGAAKITDLTGLSNFRNLTYLRVEGQAYTSIDLSQLTQLQQLSVWQAPITSIDVSHNTQLTMLGISETSLTSVDLSALTSLVELDAQNAGTLPYVMSSGTNVQGLTALDVSSNAKLARIYASYNRLTTLDLSKNVLINQLEVDHNTLTSLTLAGGVDQLDTVGNPNLTVIFSDSSSFTTAVCAAISTCQIDPTTTIVAQ